MPDVRLTDDFRAWLHGLRDDRAKAHILRRIDRMQQGNLGDVKSLGGGLSEARVDYGPGYRLYLAQKGRVLVVLLSGGDKGSQRRDIAAARVLLGKLEG